MTHTTHHISKIIIAFILLLRLQVWPYADQCVNLATRTIVKQERVRRLASSCELPVQAESYLVTDARAVRPGGHPRHRGSHMGAAWWPPTCSLCSSAGRPPQGPGCWCPRPRDLAWSGLEEGERLKVTPQCCAEQLLLFLIFRILTTELIGIIDPGEWLKLIQRHINLFSAPLVLAKPTNVCS